MRAVRLVLIALVLLLVAGCAAGQRAVGAAAVVGTGVFVADDGQSVRAVYRDDDSVTLTFADGREEVLHIAISGSGARYTQGDREWWEHQGEATYSVDGQVMFRGKRQ